MTLVLGPASKGWELIQAQFGLNELASGYVLAKQIGSVFSRQADAGIFRLLSEKCGVRVKSVPNWLENFKLSRKPVLRGDRMRIVGSLELMKDISIFNLEGFLAVVVLCTRYVEPEESILRLIKGVLTEELPTSTVDCGTLKDAQGDIWRTWTPLIRSWIQAVLSTDADSEQCRMARTYLVELAQIGACAKLFSRFGRTWLHNATFVRDFLGGETHAGHYEIIQETDRHRVQQRVFDTMSATVATMGLAAAANGADVVVECVSRRKGKEIRQYLPKDRKSLAAPYYLIRLWLCTPPMEIYDTPREEQQEEYARNIVYGGELEISIAVAQELDFWDDSRSDMHDRVINLWRKGVAKGVSMEWLVPACMGFDNDLPVGRSPKLYLQLADPKGDIEISGVKVERLIGLFMEPFRFTPSLKSLLRVIAQIIDDEYGYRDYTEQSKFFSAAMELVFVATTVGSWKKLCKVPENNLTYAFNLDAVTVTTKRLNNRKTGDLRRLMLTALSLGATVPDLLWGAALLWGGSNVASHGYQETSDRVIGIVSPQCTILLDFICNPYSVAESGLPGSIMSVHFGSVPLLPRDPSSGYVIAGQDMRNPGRNLLTLSSTTNRTTRALLDPDVDLVFRFEANVTGSKSASSAYLVGYYKGDMAFELDPLKVFTNLLIRRFHRVTNVKGKKTDRMTESQAKPVVHYLGYEDFLEHKAIYCEDSIAILRLHLRNPGWLIAAAGCVSIGNFMIQVGEENITEAKENDLLTIVKID